jgi:hypothetical protein
MARLEWNGTYQQTRLTKTILTLKFTNGGMKELIIIENGSTKF